MPTVKDIEIVLPKTILVEVVSENVIEVAVVYNSSSITPGSSTNSGFYSICGPIALSGGMLVTTNSNGLLVMADPTNPAHNGQAIGMLASAVMPGALAFATVSGFIDQPWTFVPGEQLFLGASGQPVTYTNLPPGIVFVLNIGAVVFPTRIELNVAPLPFTVA